MRIYPFIKKAELSKADRVIKRVSPDLVGAVRNLSEADVKKLFNGFVPLDFLSLIQKVNPRVLTRTLEGEIKKALRSKTEYREWIKELNLDEDEAVSQVFTYILNNDPKSMGALTQIIEDGSYGTSYRPYTTKSKSKTRAATTVRNVGGLGVPTCPNQLKSGTVHPLWTVSAEGGDLKIVEGVDKSDRCTYRESLGEMSVEQFENLKKSKEGLTEDQIKSLSAGDLELIHENGETLLKCTFHAKLNRFKPFLGFQAVGAITNVLSPERRKMGRGGAYWVKQTNRLKELEEKEKTEEGLTQEERKELKKVRKYIQEKQKDFVATPQSLDAPMQGTEGEGKSLHDVETGEDSDDDMSMSVDAARLELERGVGEREVAILQSVAQKTPLTTLVKDIGRVMELSSKDPEKKSLEKKIEKEALRIAQEFFSAGEVPNTCNTCGAELGSDASRCMYADQMRSTVLQAYQEKDSISGVDLEVKRLSTNTQDHYRASNLSPVLSSIYSGVEVSEDDLDLDLGDFKSFNEEMSPPAKKFSTKELRDKIKSSLSPDQLAAYLGTDIGGELEVTEEDASRIKYLTMYIQKIIQDIFMQDDDERTLENSLITLMIAYGVH